jgi:hypothetical protein
MKQTAVEWLYERFLFAGYAAPAEWKEKAKEMEKEQIKDAYRFPNTLVDMSSEQYYNETYNQNK